MEEGNKQDFSRMGKNVVTNSYNALISAIPGGICVNNFDEEFSLVYANQGYYDLVGYTKQEHDELFPIGGIATIHPNMRDEILADAISQLQHSNTFNLKAQISHKTKGYVWINLSGRLVFGSERGLIYTVMVDISEHMAVIEKLEQEQNFNSLISSLTDDAFFDCDILAGTIRYSQNFARRFNISEFNENYPECVIKSGIVASEYIHRYENRFASSTKDVIEEEVHLITPSGEDVYYYNHYNIIFDSMDIPIRAIGKMTDITKHHQRYSELATKVNEDHRFKEAVLSDSIATFEYNITKNLVLTMSIDFQELFDGSVYNTEYDKTIESFARILVHPDDTDSFLHHVRSQNLISEYFSGKKETVVEFRMLNREGEYIWVRYTTGLMMTDLANEIKGFTYIKDIHKERMQQLELKYKAERDSLTGLYNKTTTESLIKAELSGNNLNEQSALLIIDVDNFKGINDNLGHLSGDIVLTSLSDKLKILFRTNDIIGRVGGDEFFVFMKNIPSIDIAVGKAREINKAFKNTYKENNVECTISASIGIAFYPTNGDSFEALYKNADIALYKTKERGKNSYTVYSGQTQANYRSTRTEIDKHSSLHQKSFKNNKVEYLFKLLYEGSDTKKAVSTALELMTNHFDFCRGYIFDVSPDRKYLINTTECCAEGIPPLINKMREIPIEAVENILQELHSNGYFVLHDDSVLNDAERSVIEQRGIKSLFHLGIFERGELTGFIGFDDCKLGRDLSSAELDEFVTICNVLATFITKLHSAQRSEQNLKITTSVMDNLNSFTYVVDEDTLEIQFMNQMTKEVSGGIIGTPCYKTFRDSTKQCADCPIKHLNADKGINRYNCEIYNERFKMWTNVSACYIDWVDGKRSCLVNCVDISKYHKE